MDKFEIGKKLEELSDRITPDGLSESEQNEILSELDEIINTDPTNTEAYFWKEMIYEMAEDYENAIAMNEVILRINPNDEAAKDNIKNCREFMQWNTKISELDLDVSKSKENNAPDLLDKISIWHILIFKAIVIAIIIYFYSKIIIFH
ncbi:hypothetical protein J6P92_09390 [bacterium]|nr:hypothetical protein [bacterium]